MSLVSLIVIDVLISVFVTGFTYESGGNKLKAYFSYGYSTESKLKALMGEDDSVAASISRAGWYSELPKRISDDGSPCKINISIYGMSFTSRIGAELKKINECFMIRKIAGPGAPLSHSFHTLNTFKDQEDSKYIVVGILASVLPHINTVGHFNASFEYPGSHTYPRYYIKNGKLESSGVPFNNLKEVRRALLEPKEKKRFLEYLNQHDAYYDPLVFGYSWADYSVALRMLRRSYAQNNKQNNVLNYFDDSQFTNFESMADVSRAILKEFISDVKSIGKHPIVILINDKNYAESLDPVFVDLLKELKVSYISSTGIIDSLNHKNFEEDGHFTQENDMKLAVALSQLIPE